jgi:PAS domain S-box-containing protein
MSHLTPTGDDTEASGPPLDAFAQPVAVVDRAGRVRAANAGFAALTGVAAEALPARPRPLLHVVSPQGPSVDLFDLVAGLPLPAQGVGTLWRADGRAVDVAWSLGLWSEAGDPRYVLTCTDITEDKCLTCAIKASREKYRRAFDDQTELVCRFEPDTRILFVNEAYAAALGSRPRDMIGRRLADFLSPADQRAFTDYLATFTPEDPVREGEEVFERPRGGALHQRWRRRAIFHPDGRLAAVQSVGWDVTAQRRRDQERVRLERIITASPVVGLRLRWAPGFPVDYVSANITRFGWRPEDLVDGRVPIRRLVHPADRRRLAQALRTHPHGEGDPLRQVFRIVARDGTELWAEATFQADLDIAGALTHLDLAAVDVTTFMQSRARLRDSERRLRDFAIAANDWFWEVDSDLRFVWFSENVRERYGEDFQFALGRRYLDIADTSDDHERWQEHRADLNARRPFRDFRLSLSLPGGLRRRYSISGRPVFGDGGRFQGYRGTSRDVTREERMSHALAESQRRYETIFNYTDIGLLHNDLGALMVRLADLRAEGVSDLRTWLADTPGGLTDLIALIQPRDANPAALDMHRARSLEELRTLIDVHARHPQYSSIYIQLLCQIWDGVEVVRLQGPRVRLDGARIDVLNSFRVPRTAEEARHVAISMFDISDRLAAERAMRDAMEEARFANRAKSEFLANMSHELRTPLNAIIGFSDVLANEVFGPLGQPQYQDYAKGIHESGSHLLALITDILDLSKIEAGNLRVETASVDLAAVVDAALLLVSGRSAADRLEFSNDVVPGTRLRADPLRLKQILINLLSNAAKFTPAGGRVTVASRLDGADGGSRLVEVTDSGIGMTEDEQVVALSVFGQVQSPFARRQHGTGLGLPICVKLMEAHGGALEIISAPGHGTCIRLRFPAS